MDEPTEVTLVIKIGKDADPGLVAILRVLTEYLNGSDELSVLPSETQYSETQFVTKQTMTRFLRNQGEPEKAAPSQAIRALDWLWQSYGKGPLPGILVVCTKCEKVFGECRCYGNGYQYAKGWEPRTGANAHWKYGITSLLALDLDSIERMSKPARKRLTALQKYLRETHLS